MACAKQFRNVKYSLHIVHQHTYRVATVREKSLENEFFFQVREKSGNFNFSQGN